MALPFILAVSILIAAGIFFFTGRASNSIPQRAIFISFAGLLILLCGAFMMSEGLQLPIQDTITESGPTHTIAYQTVENTEGSAAWMLFNAVFWFGGVVILLSLVYTAVGIRSSRVEAKRDVLDW